MSKNLTMSTTPKPGQNGEYDLAGFMFNPVNATIAIIQVARMLVFNILRASCVPVELIFRRKFGERHFNLWLYLSGAMWLFLFATGWINIPESMGFHVSEKISNTVIFSVVGVIFYFSFLRELFLRKFRRIDADLHSRYDGDPLQFLFKLPFAKDSNGNKKEYFVRQVYEPLFLVVLGIIVTILLNPQTGSWLFISAIGMALKEHVKAQFTRNALLDHIDAEISAQNIKAALAGAPPEKTKGVYIAGLPGDGKKREKLKDILNKNQQES